MLFRRNIRVSFELTSHFLKHFLQKDIQIWKPKCMQICGVFLIREWCTPSQKFWSDYPISCVQKYTKTKEEDKEKFWCTKFFVHLREWSSSVCFAFLLSPSACQTPQPTFPACGFVSGENTGMFLPFASPSLCCVLWCLPGSESLVLLPLFHPWKQRTWWGGGRRKN